MDEFDVTPAEGFSATVAFERMLRLLLVLFDEVQEYRRDLILSDGPDVLDYHLDEAFVAGLRVARDDTKELIRQLQLVDFSLSSSAAKVIDPAVLRFKMMAIKTALYSANSVHPYRGRAIRRGWPLYRRALLSLFKVMDGPLAAAIAATNGPSNPLEFKQGIEALILLNSGTSA
ncbi:hypothetical protein [uncultured Brevundimonas sp.]|uniref:hypothetical protein n=1 Tax=uncultured Brevundimonas sp. TaxID=213418 RepID=UPI002634D038|nr:hypothetical protein [uncultured Brevundimonas sp.]